MLGLWTELLERLPELPVSRELTPAQRRARVALPVPEEPMPVGDLVAHLRELTFEQSPLMGHPAFFAYIIGAGTVPGAAAELLAAGLNPCLRRLPARARGGRDRAAPDALAGRGASGCPRDPAG